jgi:pyrimidine-specific ribonucleoside hydrolase
MMGLEHCRALKKEKLTILALGPMTNIATLIQNHPDIIPN